MIVRIFCAICCIGEGYFRHFCCRPTHVGRGLKYSKSTGEEPNRKVVIKPSGKQSYRGKSDGSRQNRRGRDEYKKTAAPREEAADLAEKPTEHKAVESKTLDDNVKLYSKIEL